jgi:titin
VAGTPTNIAGTVGNGQVTLSWTAPANNGAAITDYVVQSCVGSSCSTFAHSPSATAGIIVTGLTNGTAYTFKIAAVNLAGTGTAATSSAFTPRTVPNAPTSVRAVADNTTGIDVSWTAPAFNGGADITDYVVEYATENTDYVVFADGVSTGTSVKVTGLTQGVEYTFRIAARNIAGQGAYSAGSLNAIATARTKPGKPTASVASTIDGAVNVEWKFEASQTNGGAEIERFDVEWARVGTNSWSSQSSDEQTIRLEGLSIGLQYKFRITATNAAGTSIGSGGWSAFGGGAGGGGGSVSASNVGYPGGSGGGVYNLSYGGLGSYGGPTSWGGTAGNGEAGPDSLTPLITSGAGGGGGSSLSTANPYGTGSAGRGGNGGFPGGGGGGGGGGTPIGGVGGNGSHGMVAIITLL